jgi:hypothetical protein
MDKMSYAKYLVRKPIYEAGATVVKNRQRPTMTLISNAQVPGANCYIELGWVFGMPEPNPHIFEMSHRYDEIVMHYGSNPVNPEELGGEIEFFASGQPLTFNTNTALFVPQGIKHGPLIWKKFQKPHIEMAFIIGTGDLKEGWGGSGAHEQKEGLPQKTDDIDYEKYLVRKPIHEANGLKIKGRRSPLMTYMSNALVPRCNIYIGFNWIWDIPDQNPYTLEHSHDYAEILLFVGSDHNNPEDLGGEIEVYVGGQPLTFNTTSALFIPKGMRHGPLTWKVVNKPHIEMAILLGGGNYVQSKPVFLSNKE